MLQTALTGDRKSNAKLREALGRDSKGNASIGIHAVAIGLAFLNSWIALVLYVAVGLLWLIPDKRFEAKLLGR